MATSGKSDDTETETETSIDVSGFMRVFANDDDEEDAEKSTDDRGDISMFCKACLHPYCGEEKAGTIVLRCERCGQTDTVLEERVGSLNPQEWIGNLMMNRFMQVVKEQEDLSANLMDPSFAEDEYQRISLSLSDYTFNVEKIAAQLFSIAKKASLATEEDKSRIEDGQKVDTSVAGLEEVQAMNATKTLIEIHKTLAMNDPKHAPKVEDEASVNVEEETCSDQKCLSDQQTDANDENNTVEGTDEQENVESSPDVSSNEIGDAKTENEDKAQDVLSATNEQDVKGDEENRNESLELVRGRLDGLGTIMKTLIETIIVKYNLPADIIYTVERRLINADKAKNRLNSGAESKAEDDLDLSETEDNQDDEKVSNDEQQDDEKESVVETESDVGTESRTIFNVPTETIQKEVFDALGHKLQLRFDSGPCTARKINLDKTDSPYPEFLTEELDTENTHTDDLEKVTAISKGEADEENLEQPTENSLQNENEKCEERISEEDGVEENEEIYMINFYSLSSEFIRELQIRKSRALAERKNRALENIHNKIERLKEEMERVEEAVTNELTLAYKRKMKKVEKQRKQLDEKHEQVKEAERLLEYYAMTGQQDKVAELMEQFNIQYEN